MGKYIGTQKRKTLGLALGGGAARGVAHIGILQELERAGISIDYIAGTSVGALVGALYASGINPEEMAEMSLNMTWRDLILPSPTLRSLVSGKRIVTFLEKYCRVSRFEELQRPLAVIVSDLDTGTGVPITTGELFPAVLASCSIPLLFPPVTLNGRQYIDGGFAALIPVETVRAMGADIAIACDVNYHANRKFKVGNFASMLVRLMILVANRNALEAKQQADIVINVDVRDIGLTSLGKVAELLQRGRTATQAVLPQLRKLGIMPC